MTAQGDENEKAKNFSDDQKLAVNEKTSLYKAEKAK